MAPPKGIQPERDGRVQCLECGRWYRALAPHLIQTEDMEPNHYRERHGLPATLPLVASDISQTLSEQTGRRVAEGSLPKVNQRFSAGEIQQAGVQGNARHRETAPRPGVREAHQRGIVKGRTQAHDNARQRRDDLAKLHGYPDWEALIRGTQQQPTAAVAKMVGRNLNNIVDWRRRILGDDWASTERRLPARRATAFARLDALFAERGWPDLDAAVRALGGIVATANACSTKPRTLRAWEHHKRGLTTLYCRPSSREGEASEYPGRSATPSGVAPARREK